MSRIIPMIACGLYELGSSIYAFPGAENRLLKTRELYEMAFAESPSSRWRARIERKLNRLMQEE